VGWYRLKAALVVALVCAAETASADVFDGLDVGAATGIVTGAIEETKTDGSVQTFKVGGIPLAAMLNRDLAPSWTGSLQFQVLLDVANQQMIRQGLAGTLSYHILGGARRLVTPGNTLKLTSANNYNLSIDVRGGIFDYAAANKRDPTENVSGGIWEMAVGIEYRRDLSEQNALGASLMISTLTLPASVERLATKTRELLFFWRTYF
jgi:hypothetical protein